MKFSTGIIKKTLSVFVAAFFLVIAYKYVVTEEQKELLFTVPFTDHLISAMFLAVAFLISGIEFRIVYKESEHLKLDLYDTLTIPYVINLWGYIIPFQGSFLYFLGYVKMKYGKELKSSTSIYAFVFLLSLTLFGLIGIAIYFWASMQIPTVLFAFIGFSLIPILLLLLKKIMSKISLKNKFMHIIKALIDSMSSLFRNRAITAKLLILNLLLLAVNSGWSYWICQLFGYEIPFAALFIVGVLIQLTMLVKITPGNLGLNQLANGGVFILLGFDPSIGVLISLFQFLTLALFSFPIGIFCSIKNGKFFSIKRLRQGLFR